MRKIVSVLLVLSFVATGSFASGGQESSAKKGAEAPKEIVFMDTQSGANFQQWFQTIALPAAQDALVIMRENRFGNECENSGIFREAPGFFWI